MIAKNTLHRDTFTFTKFNISSDKMPESLVNGTSEEVWTLNTPLAQSDPEVRDLHMFKIIILRFSIFVFHYTGGRDHQG